MALLLWLLLSLLWGGGCQFELQEAIQELQSENTQLQGKIQNLTEALSELRLFVWNRSQGPESTSEHLLHEHLSCHPDAHWRNVGASFLYTPFSLLVVGVSLMTILSIVIG